MAAKILSIEVGNSVTRVCEMDFRAKDPKVHKYFWFPTPQGTVEDGMVQDRSDLSIAIKKALAENKVKTKQVVFTVTSSKMVTREILIPALKLNQVGNYVKANANDYFPIDLTTFEIAHVVLGGEKGDDGNDKLRVLAIAAGRDLIQGYAKLAADAGLRLVTIDYSGNSIYQIMKNECGDVTKLVIKMEDNNTVATIISNHSMKLQRNIAYGFDRAVQAYMDLSESYEINANEAFSKMSGKSYVKPVLSEKTKIMEPGEIYHDGEQEEEKRKRITETFTQFISNLSRVIELYNSKMGKEPVSEIVLVGMGAEIAGLASLLTNELRIPTRTVRNFASASTFQTLDSVSMGRYVGVLGAAFAPVTFASDDMRKKGSKKVPYSLLTTLVYIVFFVVVGGLLVSAYLPYSAAQSRKQELEALEAQYAEAEEVHKRYVTMKEFHEQVKEKYNMTLHSNDELIAFLTELEETMPSDLIVTQFYSNAEGAQITMNVPQLEQAAVIMDTLRGFGSLLDVSFTDITADGEVQGYYNFTVNCLYYPVGMELSEEAAE